MADGSECCLQRRPKCQREPIGPRQPLSAGVCPRGLAETRASLPVVGGRRGCGCVLVVRLPSFGCRGACVLFSTVRTPECWCRALVERTRRCSWPRPARGGGPTGLRTQMQQWPPRRTARRPPIGRLIDAPAALSRVVGRAGQTSPAAGQRGRRRPVLLSSQHHHQPRPTILQRKRGLQERPH
jgi:hypothetical protein